MIALTLSRLRSDAPVDSLPKETIPLFFYLFVLLLHRCAVDIDCVCASVCLYLQEAYTNLPVEVKVTQLLASIQNKYMDEEARLMAAVLLRRLFTSDFNEFYTNVRFNCKP